MKANCVRVTILFVAVLLTGCALGSPVSLSHGLQLRQTDYSNLSGNAEEWQGATIYLAAPEVEGDEAAFGRDLAPEVHQLVVRSLRQRNVQVVRDTRGDHHGELRVRLVVDRNRDDGTDKRVRVILELNDAEQHLVRGSVESFMMNNRETHAGVYRPLRTIVAEALGDLYRQPIGYRLATGEPTAVAQRPARSEEPAARPERAAPSPAPRTTRFTSATPQRQSYALVVGVEAYRDLPPPTGARSDAETFAAMLRETMGIPGENVRVLLDERATRSDILASLEWLEETVPAGARIYLFFSGHGSPEPAEGTSYLLPYEATPETMTRTGLTLTSVLERLEATSAREVLAFVDACFSGMGDRSVLPEGTRPLVPAQGVSGGSRVAVFSASQASEISGTRPGQSVGLFTHFLVEALGSGRADLDGDGQISLAELQAYVGPRVAREAREASRSQTPSLFVADDLGASEDVVVVWGISPLD